MTVTLRELVSERRGGAPAEAGALGPLLLDLAAGFVEIAAAVERGALAGALGDAGTTNAQGEAQKQLDVVANELLVSACARSARVAAIASEEMEAPRALAPGGEHLVVVDPLDGSSNLGVNVAVGSIFSILRRGGTAEPFLRPGLEQACAGYAIYGPATMLVLRSGAASAASRTTGGGARSS